MACCANTNNNTTQWIDLRNDHNSSLSLKPSNLKLLVNQFDNATPEIIMTLKKFIHPNIGNIEIPHKNKSLSLFHITACSLNKNFDDLQHLLSCTKTKFDIIAISETRIARQVYLLNNLNLNDYSFEFTLTETSARCTLLYIANHLSYKCRNDLDIYRKMNLNLFLLKLST